MCLRKPISLLSHICAAEQRYQSHKPDPKCVAILVGTPQAVPPLRLFTAITYRHLKGSFDSCQEGRTRVWVLITCALHTEERNGIQLCRRSCLSLLITQSIEDAGH